MEPENFPANFLVDILKLQNTRITEKNFPKNEIEVNISSKDLENLLVFEYEKGYEKGYDDGWESAEGRRRA